MGDAPSKLHLNDARIVFKRLTCMYKCERGIISEKSQAREDAHTKGMENRGTEAATQT